VTGGLETHLTRGWTVTVRTVSHSKVASVGYAFNRAFNRITPATMQAINQAVVQAAVQLGLERRPAVARRHHGGGNRHSFLTRIRIRERKVCEG
jgi:hypothetical protein